MRVPRSTGFGPTKITTPPPPPPPLSLSSLAPGLEPRLFAFWDLFLAAFCFAVSGKHSRAGRAVESRAMWPMRQFWQCRLIGPMQMLRQLGCREFGKRAGKLRFMRQSCSAAPAAQLAQRLVHVQGVDQIARGRQIQHRFRRKRNAQCGPVLRRSSVAERRADNKRSSGINATTAVSSSMCGLSGPITVFGRGNNSSCSTGQIA